MSDITTTEIMETLQELMQMTSDGFTTLEGRMDGLEGRIENLEGGMKSLDNRIYQLERQYNKLNETVSSIANEQKAQTNDILEILDRLLAIEKRLPKITEKEIKEMQTKLQALIDWAIKSAKVNNITLKLPKS